ncbi:MAG: tRNA (N(6)-L-threonylcarbamoyladenosine(37)-C(2))-methylthiotransferase MtaB [Spirochaetaceae bacterium]|nr:tRNA (N(6)-L-threonylcarbamoyladenosine(37)-C(2))-methylthiotransferase MtaB [Spirochaetaceae bacterium]
MYTIHFETLGCKLNQIETESIARFCADAGFGVTMAHSTASQAETAPVLSIVNTCTVTAKAEQKARRIIRMLLAKFPFSAVLVTGCYAQVEKAQIEQIDSRIVVVPGTAKDTLADFPQFFMDLLTKAGAPKTAEEAAALAKDLRAWQPLRQIPAEQTENRLKPNSKDTKAIESINKFRLATDSFMHHSRGSIKIQDGCSNRCAYCRICIARGESVSLAPAEVLKRVRDIESGGQTEVVLTGVNLTLYRGTLQTESGERKMDFADLLEYLLENTDTISFRISSLYPERVDDALCRIIAHKRVRPHFHLSVQSGSNAILKAMHRPYTAETVVAAVENLRKAKDNPFIACDIIAGFPGETDKDFEQTQELCRKCRFTYIHAFPFSPRPGTEAYTMKNQIPQRIAGERVKWLSDFACKSKTEYAKSFEGKTLKAVVEKRETNIGKAVTENFLHIYIEENKQTLKDLAGKEVSVLIKQALDISGKDEETEATAVLVCDGA